VTAAFAVGKLLRYFKATSVLRNKHAYLLNDCDKGRLLYMSKQQAEYCYSHQINMCIKL